MSRKAQVTDLVASPDTGECELGRQLHCEAMGA